MILHPHYQYSDSNDKEDDDIYEVMAVFDLNKKKQNIKYRHKKIKLESACGNAATNKNICVTLPYNFNVEGGFHDTNIHKLQKLEIF